MRTLSLGMRSKKVKTNQIFTIRKIKNQKKWTREEDEMLIGLADQFREKQWKEISKRFANKNSLQCFSRYKRIRPGIVKGSWKKEEDVQIIELVRHHSKSWSKISKILGTRNGKQIRDRFINVLDPEIRKGKFTDEEDRKLVLLFKQNGPKWATIAKQYPNRTADMIKNRFHSSIKKKLGLENVDSKSLDLKDSEMTFSNGNLEEIYEMEPIKKQVNVNPISMSLQNTLNCSKSPSQNDSSNNLCMEIESFENNKFSNYSQKDIECDFMPYTSNHFNFDILNYDKEVKSDDRLYAGAFNWNFDDYFSILN